MNALAGLLESVWHGPATQKIYTRVPDDHVLDPGYTSRVFERDQSYFSISLTRMFLADARKLWQGIAPLTVAAAEFDYGGQRQSVPFVVGKDMLSNIQAYLKDQDVDYRNTKILGPCPYTGGDVALFVGLFQTPSGSAASEFFGLLGNIAGAFDLTGLSAYLPVANAVTASLGRLLGLSGTNLRIGARDEFAGDAGKSNSFREGFLAYVNCSPGELKDPLWARDGELLSGPTRDSAKPLTHYDHCLVKLDWRAERNDYTSLPFHRSWIKARDLIWQDQADKARLAFMELAQQVAGSPDLTARHRPALLAAYRANFEAELESYRTISGGLVPAPATRGSRGSGGSAKANLQSDAKTSRDAGFGNEVQTTLLDLATNFPKLSETRKKDQPLTDDVLSDQMRVIGTPDVDAQQLADALVVANFRTTSAMPATRR